VPEQPELPTLPSSSTQRVLPAALAGHASIESASEDSSSALPMRRDLGELATMSLLNLEFGSGEARRGLM